MRGPVSGMELEQGASPLGLDDITARPAVFKCMGRSYSASRSGAAVVIQDVTDITRPHPLGRAEPCADTLWSVRTPRGLLAGRTDGTLEAVAALWEVCWPLRDPCPQGG